MAKNPYERTVYGVGYIGLLPDGTRPRTETRAYKVWHGMLQRCYDGKERHKTYENCTVAEEWHCYSTFLQDLPFIEGYEYWRDNPRQKIALDKDKRQQGVKNKVYCKYTVEFISQSNNMQEASQRMAKEQARPIIATSVATGIQVRFDSIGQASKMLITKGADKTRVRKIVYCLNGERPTAYGYTWEYEKE